MANRATAPPADTPFRPTFALPDAAGRLRTAEEFSGKHLLVFFGFTNCPDVCPMALIEVAQVMDGLGGQADLVQPLFISIDPTRDRGLELAEYTAAFHPSILGLAERRGADPRGSLAVSGFSMSARTVPARRMVTQWHTAHHST
ncbi:SCO family protein [Hoeflea alexandrii]|nr:SCO family protein [Hoeflea alexandrii]